MGSIVKEKQCNINEEKCRRHPRWTRQENLTLIQAKEITENGPHKGRKIGSTLSSENIEPKWVMISAYCKKQGVDRGPAHCRKRWSNLIGDYKKVKTWEANLKDKGESFWIMRNDLRKKRKLPVSFDYEVFKVLVAREVGDAGAVEASPLQAVPAGACYGEGDDFEEEDLADIVEPEPEPELENVPRSEPENEEVENVNGGQSLGDENAMVSDDAKEKILEFGLESKNQTTEKPFVESPADTPEPCSDAFKESWPSISYWDSPESSKRRRLSTDDPKSHVMEAEMMKVLEENNKMVKAQLDIHNTNIQLDREQRKETTDVLVAALGNLTSVLAKIAEKL